MILTTLFRHLLGFSVFYINSPQFCQFEREKMFEYKITDYRTREFFRLAEKIQDDIE